MTRVEFDDVSLISITKVLLFIHHCSHRPLNCCAVLVCTRLILLRNYDVLCLLETHEKYCWKFVFKSSISFLEFQLMEFLYNFYS